MPARILIVDDEIGMQVALREVLQRKGYTVTVAQDAMTALGILDEETFDLMLTDVRMPEMTGMELLERVQVRWAQMPVLVMTAYGTIEDAVDAMKKGAADYLLKPFSTETVEEVVARQLENARQAVEDDEADAVVADVAEGEPDSSFQPIAASVEMQRVLALAREVADSTATILIQGESGTGKEVLARFIHQHSGRRANTFVALNCAALPEGLLESELFGHEKGSFTGAVLSRKGKFELAHNGTLLLDEVSEMAMLLQAKLLRALQEREIDPIGAQKPVAVNVRVVATTNRDLAQFVEQGDFREDLYYRLQVISIVVPPLRERKKDILPLSDYFVRRLCRINRRPRKRLSTAMRQHLLEKPWPGNVRELENYLERAVLLCKGDEIRPDNIFLEGAPRCPSMPSAPPRPTAPEQAAGAENPPVIPPTYGRTDHVESTPGSSILGADELVTLEEMERRLILRTLDQVNGNRTRAADLLGVSVRTIRNKLNQYGLSNSSAASKSASPAS